VSGYTQILSYNPDKPPFIGSNLRSWENSKWIAVGLLDQTRFNRGMSKSMSTLWTCEDPTWHRAPFLAVPTDYEGML
jgi:hypothetical protein